jgi:hypothetical protein
MAAYFRCPAAQETEENEIFCARKRRSCQTFSYKTFSYRRLPGFGSGSNAIAKSQFHVFLAKSRPQEHVIFRRLMNAHVMAFALQGL